MSLQCLKNALDGVSAIKKRFSLDKWDILLPFPCFSLRFACHFNIQYGARLCAMTSLKRFTFLHVNLDETSQVKRLFKANFHAYTVYSFSKMYFYLRNNILLKQSNDILENIIYKCMHIILFHFFLFVFTKI